MSVPVMKPERRRIPRIRPEGIAYINFEGDNGGILVNVSEEGLCFQSVAPMQADQDKLVRFWFSAEGNRIDAEGRLAWIDERRKTGGVQFQNLSAEARLQLHGWLTQSGEPPSAPPRLPVTRNLAPAKNPAVPTRADERPNRTTSPPARPVSPTTTLEPRSNHKPGHISSFVDRLLRWLNERHIPLRWTEYSRGLATGLLVSGVVLGGFLLRANRRHIGELLIRMGEGFGATVQTHTPSSQAVVAKGSVQDEATVSNQPAQRMHVAKAPIGKRDAESVRPLLARPAQADSGTHYKRADFASAPASRASIGPLPMSSQVRGVALEETAERVTVQPEKTLGLPATAKVLEIKPSGQPAQPAGAEELNSGVPLGKYFEVGKFSDELRADEIMNKLAQTGYHGVVIPKSLLWMSSYQVLAGPFPSEKEAQIARKGLRSEGFKAQSLPRQSREFRLPVVRKLYSVAEVPEGFVVTWESFDVDATVRFVRGDDTVATVRGTWVKQKAKNDRDGVMYDANPDGSKRLLQIWFRGMDQSVVFPVGSGNHTLIF